MIIYFSHSDMGHQVWHSRPDVALDGWYGTGHPVSSYLWNLAHLWILHLLGSVSKIKNLDIDSPFSPNFHYFTNSSYPTNTKLTWKLLNCCNCSADFGILLTIKIFKYFTDENCKRQRLKNGKCCSGKIWCAVPYKLTLNSFFL